MNWRHRVDLVVATFCCLLVGVIKGLLYLIVPWFFAIVMTLYAVRFLAEVWAWRRLSVAERAQHSRPGHLMNYNHALSPVSEWVLASFGFFALLFWIRIAPAVLG